MMDDKFLYTLRKQPAPEFVWGLQRKLHQGRASNEVSFLPFGRSKLIAVVAILVSVVLITSLAMSPVRAFVTSVIARVAGLSFEVTQDYPGDNNAGGEVIIHPRIMSRDEALAAYPHSIKMPDSIPAGYILDEDEVQVYIGEGAGPFANTVEFRWNSAEVDSFILRITDHDPSVTEIVAPDSIQEIQLGDGYPAVLIRGGWDADQKMWKDGVGLRLRWSVGELTYDLMGRDLEKLIQIAASTIN